MEDQQQRYERARARVQAIKGFYIHASVFVVVNLGLFIINAFTADSQVGYGGFTGRCWAGASAGEHTPLASSASEGAGLGGEIGRNARPGR
jgi:2TM domain